MQSEDLRIYEPLLLAYPASFWNEYGEDMRAVFVRRHRDAGGVLARVALFRAERLRPAA